MSAKQYFQAHGSLLIRSDEGIYIILHPDGTVEATAMYKGTDGACFTIIKDYKNVRAFMKAFKLDSFEEIKTISWGNFFMA
ncbi:hypothetical protein HDC92_002496 [Pedobacter sp. AK017]|uniref:hypothetical protein n=1 Tax=Pedobacter sp. AK017 TaxID=2723073 RepID=UPI00160D05E5|nr:hypothetical protein [Pedobacter sp. AK017]MBB5438815.1 hypothetical protein [Pedobacter sp. AK017]